MGIKYYENCLQFKFINRVVLLEEELRIQIQVWYLQLTVKTEFRSTLTFSSHDMTHFMKEYPVISFHGSKTLFFHLKLLQLQMEMHVGFWSGIVNTSLSKYYVRTMLRNSELLYQRLIVITYTRFIL